MGDPESPRPPAGGADVSGPVGDEFTDELEDKKGGIKSITGWVEERAHSVVSRIYEARADEIEQRARRIVNTAYEDSADDLEDRAVNAMRRALAAEADRIRESIEHGISVKKREVRLSLVVLVVASLIYLALYYFTVVGGGGDGT